jgi:hypothetical protein
MTLLRILAAAALLSLATGTTAFAREFNKPLATHNPGDGAAPCGHRAGCTWHHTRESKFESVSQCRDDAGNYCPE